MATKKAKCEPLAAGGNGFIGNLPASGDTTVVDRPPLPPVRPPFQSHDEPPSHDDDPLISPSEFARLIGRSPQTILNWIKDGLLEVHPEPGGRNRIRRSVVNRFLRGTALPQKEI